METLFAIDKNLFTIVNGAHNSILDFIMFWASTKLIWTPLYAYLLYLLYKKYDKKILILLPIITLQVICTDQFSGFIKNTALRLRPCHEPSLQGIVHIVNNYCGGQYGFVSAHAANTMGLVIFIIMLLPNMAKSIKFVLAIYILLVGYSRIYLAAHYPLDIIGGWVIGIYAGYIFGLITTKKIITSQEISINE